MAKIWDAAKAAGWGVVYYATIEGLPDVYTEETTGLALPSGYTAERPVLIIDDSAEVGQEIDRRKGLGKGLPLTLQLRDTPDVRTLLAPGDATHLTETLDGSSTASISVADTSGLASSGDVYIGIERISYTGTTATTLTGITRGQTGQGYPQRRGTPVTTTPHRWRGREVRLYARPSTPSGYLPGTALADDAIEIWRGRIRNPPQRDGGLWTMDALALDRVLADDLPDPISGKVAHAADAGAALVEMTNSLQGYGYYLELALFDSSGSEIGADEAFVQPFSNLTIGNLYSARELQTEIVDDLETAFSGATYVTGVEIVEQQPYEHPGAAGSQVYRTRLRVLFNGVANAEQSRVRLSHTDQPTGDPYVPIGEQESSFVFEWYRAGDFTSGATEYDNTPPHPLLSFGVAVQADDEHKADAAFDAATLRVVSDDLATALPEESGTGLPYFEIDGAIYSYTSASQVGPAYYLSGVRKPGGTPGLDALAIPQDTSIEVDVFAQASSMGALMRRVLQSTGDTALRGAADVLPAGAGYGLPDDALDGTAFDDFALPVETKKSRVAGRSFSDLFAGWLALHDRALVLRDVDGDQRISIVDTQPTWPSVEIADADVLSRKSFGAKAGESMAAPTSVRVKYTDTTGATGTITLRDTERALYQRPDVVTYEAQGISRDAVVQRLVSEVGPALFRRGRGEAVIRVQVGPWIDAQAGDTVGLTLEHPNVYSYSDGSLSYDATALCLARKMRLRDSRAELTLLLQGYRPTVAICPAMVVQAKSGGTAAVPNRVDVPLSYLELCEIALSQAGGSSFVVLHYKRGDSADETTGNELTIDDVTETAGVCRLSIASGTNTVAIDTSGESVLTWPDEGGNGSDWQDVRFAHIDDGNEWS